VTARILRLKWKIVLSLAAAAAAAIAAVAIPASASYSPASGNGTAQTPVFPPTLVNYFFGEVNPPNGSPTWEWASATDSENFANTTSRAVVTGNIALGSSNGLAVSGQLGVCYQLGTGPIIFGNWKLLNFTAPVGQWVSEVFSGTILPGPNGFPAGTYTVGLCVEGTSANLVYDTAYGSTAGTVIVAEDSGP
jgi:hypothetical protein